MTWVTIHDGPGPGPIADDPRYALRDGRFEDVIVDVAHQRVVIVINVGDLQVGYRQVRLRFEDARIIPDDYQLLSAAIRAEFRSDHWHAGRSVTEVRDQRFGAVPDGRHRLTLRLWPFHRFAIEFARVEVATRDLSERGPARPGRLRLSPVE